MGLFGFFKKKKKPEDRRAGFSSRRRRIISSTTAREVSPARKKGSSAVKPAAAPAASDVQPEQAETTPVTPSVSGQPSEQKQRASETESPQQVGQLKRGKSSALLSEVDSEGADTALKNFILEMGLAAPDDVENAFSRKDNSNSFIKIIVEENIINENELLAELSKKCMIPQGKLDKYRIRKKALECIDPDLAMRLMVLPVDKLGQILSVAVVNPLDSEAVKTLGRVTGLRVKSVVCTYSEFIEHYCKHYTPSGRIEGSEEAIGVSVDEPQPISPEEFRKTLRATRETKQTDEKPPAKAASTEVREVALPGGGQKEAEEPEVAEIAEVAEVAEVAVPPSFNDLDTVIEAEDTEEPEELSDIDVSEEIPEGADDTSGMDVVEPFAEEEHVIEPVIEGIEISDDDDEDERIIIEPVIVEASVSEDTPETGTDQEYIDAIRVVEEEFRQGITLGAIDLFSKWEKLHTKKRIITLKRTPDDIFSFLPLARRQ